MTLTQPCVSLSELVLLLVLLMKKKCFQLQPCYYTTTYYSAFILHTHLYMLERRREGFYNGPFLPRSPPLDMSAAVK